MCNPLTDAAATVPARDRRSCGGKQVPGDNEPSLRGMSKVLEAMPGAGHRDCNLLAVLKLSLVLGLGGQSCLQISTGLEVWVRIGLPLRTASLAAGRSKVWTCLLCLWLWPPEQGGVRREKKC